MKLSTKFTLIDSVRSAVFIHAIGSLWLCSNRTRVWRTMAGQDFMTTLKGNDMMALLILLSWEVLLKSLHAFMIFGGL